jgi:hypothetical protein
VLQKARDIEKYTSDWIEMFLDNYQVLICDAPELASAWPAMDPREQMDHRAMSMQIWGMRKTLGELYQAGLLTTGHMTKLIELDYVLLEGATAIEIAYGPSIWQLVRNLFDWGTPLREEQGSVQMAVPIGALPELANHFVR